MFEMHSAALNLSEVRGWQLAHLTGYEPRREDFRQALGQALGVAAPVELYRGITRGAARVVRLTADQYWWISTDTAGLQNFCAQLAPEAGAVTMLSAGRVRLRIEGLGARDVLARGIALDLHPREFAVGHSAQTGLHHTGVFLERVDEHAYELFVQRTFATSIKEWLLDASLPYGVSGT